MLVSCYSWIIRRKRERKREKKENMPMNGFT